MEEHIIKILSHLRAEKIKKKTRNDKDFLLTLDKEKRLLIINRTGKEIYNFCNNKVEDIIKNMKSLYPNIGSKKISVDVLRCLRDLEHRELVVLR